MYAGRIVEHADARTLFARPEHPYTWGLLKSIPRLDTPREEALVPISGRPPSLINRPSGCHFHPRCPYAVTDEHRRVDPPLEPIPTDPEHRVACILRPEIRARIWQGLKAGQPPDSLRHLAEPLTAAAPAEAAPVADEAGGAPGLGSDLT
jgi:peptide/nickel transport system ATP-binding protein